MKDDNVTSKNDKFVYRTRIEKGPRDSHEPTF